MLLFYSFVWNYTILLLLYRFARLPSSILHSSRFMHANLCRHLLILFISFNSSQHQAWFIFALVAYIYVPFFLFITVYTRFCCCSFCVCWMGVLAIIVNFVDGVHSVSSSWGILLMLLNNKITNSNEKRFGSHVWGI